MPSCTVYYIDTQNRLQDCVKLISLHSWVCQLGQSRKVPVKLNRSSSTAGDELQNEFQNLGRSQSGEAPVRGMSWVQPQCHRHTHPSVTQAFFLSFQKWQIVLSLQFWQASKQMIKKNNLATQWNLVSSFEGSVLTGMMRLSEGQSEFEAELKVWQRFVFLTLLLSWSKKIISEKWFYPNIAWR